MAPLAKKHVERDKDRQGYFAIIQLEKQTDRDTLHSSSRKRIRRQKYEAIMQHTKKQIDRDMKTMKQIHRVMMQLCSTE